MTKVQSVLKTDQGVDVSALEFFSADEAKRNNSFIGTIANC